MNTSWTAYPYRWVFDRTQHPPLFLPTGLDLCELVDITCVGDAWRRYLDPATGQIHDGAEYVAQARAAGEF